MSTFEEEELHTLLWCRGNPDKVREHAHQVSRCLLLGWRTYMSLSYMSLSYMSKGKSESTKKDDFSVTEVEGGSQLTGQTQAAEEIFILIDIDFP